MNAAQLGAWFRANKTEALLVGGAGVAGLALYTRKKNTAAAAAGVTAGASAPGTIPAAAVVSGSGVPTYDSSSYDLYNALQDEIGTLAHQNEGAAQTGATGSSVSAAVKGPIASTLLAPTGSGQLARYGTGIYEVEADGSLYGENLHEWQATGSPTNYVQLGSTLPSGLTAYTGAGNLAQRIATGASSAATAAQTSGA